MEAKEWIMIASATIVVAGWFMNSYINRLHEQSKRRTEYRLEALHSIFPVLWSLQKYSNPLVDDSELQVKLETSRSKFQLYGCKDEIESFEKVIQHIEQQNLACMIKGMNELIKLAQERIRKELGIES